MGPPRRSALLVHPVAPPCARHCRVFVCGPPAFRACHPASVCCALHIFASRHASSASPIPYFTRRIRARAPGEAHRAAAARGRGGRRAPPTASGPSRCSRARALALRPAVVHQRPFFSDSLLCGARGRVLRGAVLRAASLCVLWARPLQPGHCAGHLRDPHPTCVRTMCIGYAHWRVTRLG